MTTFIFRLVQKAKTVGGDKYVSESDCKFVVYFPQSISRINGVPKEEIKVNIDD